MRCSKFIGMTAFVALSGIAAALNVTVQQGSTEVALSNYNSVANALTALNAQPGPHTITILDSADYATAGVLNVTQNTTITVATGQTPTITNSGGSGQVIRNSFGTTAANLGIVGASSSAKLRLRHTGASTAPVINTGPYTTGTTSLILRNVTLERGGSGNGVFVALNNRGSHALSAVDLTGATGTDAITFFPDTTATLTLNGVTALSNFSGDFIKSFAATHRSTINATNLNLANRTLAGAVINHLIEISPGTGIGSYGDLVFTLDGLTNTGTTFTGVPFNINPFNGRATVTLNNLNLSTAAAVPFASLLLNSRCELVANNCNFQLPGSGFTALHYGQFNGDAFKVTYNNCSIKTNTARLVSPEYNLGNITVTFNNPTFVGACGDIVLNQTSGTITINGASPASKTDLGPLATGGFLFSRIRGGTLNLTDVTNTGNFGNENLIESRLAGPLSGEVNVNLNRCIFPDKAGKIDLRASTAANATTTSLYAVALNATNTIWNGATGQAVLIATYDQGRLSTGTITLTHCTLRGPTAQTLLSVASTGITAPFNCQVSDSIIGNYSIFDDTGTAAAQGDVALGGRRNLVVKNGSAAGGGFLAGQPGDTLNYSGDVTLAGGGSPQLTATGRIGAQSAAGGRAVGSSLSIDVDGNARPNGGTVPDIGASESSANFAPPNAARHWSSFE